jgi:hypothetical protein
MSIAVPTPVTEDSGRLQAWLCVAVLLAAVLLTHPFVEMGINDDFSYIRTAQTFAQTGHFVYNGWATAMLGWQVPAAALLIKVFGFSFSVVRIFGLLIGLLTTYLLHRVFLRFGLNPWNAAIGTLLIVLSPIFLPLVYTFMTDIPGFFCLVLCLYFCLRALQAVTDRASLLWLCLAASSNIVLGSVRQIAWLGVLTMVPCTAWLLRKRERLLPAGVILWIVGVIGILGCLHWFALHPYSVPERILSGPLNLQILEKVAICSVKSFLSLGLFSLPILLAFVRLPVQRGRNRWKWVLSTLGFAGLALAIGSIAGIALLKKGQGVDRMLAPWMGGNGNVVSAGGILSIAARPGLAPIVISMPVRILLSVIAVYVMTHCAVYLLATPPKREDEPTRLSISTEQLHVLLIPFTMAYFALLIPRAAFGTIFDRYFIAPLFVIAVYLVRFYQQRINDKLPWITTAAVLLFAAFAVAGTHDLIAFNRARINAANELRQAAVPRKEIEGGVEYDAWTQIEAWGYMNEPKIANPPDAFRALRYDPCQFWFSSYTPALVPRYILAYDTSCAGASPYAPVAYRTWLPPYSRSIYIRQVP